MGISRIFSEQCVGEAEPKVPAVILALTLRGKEGISGNEGADTFVAQGRLNSGL